MMPLIGSVRGLICAVTGLLRLCYSFDKYCSCAAKLCYGIDKYCCCLGWALLLVL